MRIVDPAAGLCRRCGKPRVDVELLADGDHRLVCDRCLAARKRELYLGAELRPASGPKVDWTSDDELDAVVVERFLAGDLAELDRRDRPALARALVAAGWTRTRVAAELRLSGSTLVRALGSYSTRRTNPRRAA